METCTVFRNSLFAILHTSNLNDQRSLLLKKPMRIEMYSFFIKFILHIHYTYIIWKMY